MYTVTSPSSGTYYCTPTTTRYSLMIDNNLQQYMSTQPRTPVCTPTHTPVVVPMRDLHREGHVRADMCSTTTTTLPMVRPWDRVRHLLPQGYYSTRAGMH